MSAFDEMHPGPIGTKRPYQDYEAWLDAQEPLRLNEKMRDAERVFRKTGITFNVYGEEEASERLIPFDIVPRHHLRCGVAPADAGHRAARTGADPNNAFLDDIYHRQEILRAGRHPDRADRRQCGVPVRDDRRAPARQRLHPQSSASTIVRTSENEFYVLEDNARTPSGVPT